MDWGSRLEGRADRSSTQHQFLTPLGTELPTTVPKHAWVAGVCSGPPLSGTYTRPIRRGGPQGMLSWMHRHGSKRLPRVRMSKHRHSGSQLVPEAAIPRHGPSVVQSSSLSACRRWVNSSFSPRPVPDSCVKTCVKSRGKWWALAGAGTQKAQVSSQSWTPTGARRGLCKPEVAGSSPAGSIVVSYYRVIDYVCRPRCRL